MTEEKRRQIIECLQKGYAVYFISVMTGVSPKQIREVKASLKKMEQK